MPYQRNVSKHLDLNPLILKFKPPHDKTSTMTVRPAKTQIILDIRPAWLESSLSTWGNIGALATHWEHSEDSDHPGHPTAKTPIRLGGHAILLVLSWGGLFDIAPTCWHDIIINRSDRYGRYWKVTEPKTDKVALQLYMLYILIIYVFKVFEYTWQIVSVVYSLEYSCTGFTLSSNIMVDRFQAILTCRSVHLWL